MSFPVTNSVCVPGDPATVELAMSLVHSVFKFLETPILSLNSTPYEDGNTLIEFTAEVPDDYGLAK